MSITKYNINEVGLNHFFGPLEAKVMDIIWSSKGLTIKEVQEFISKKSERVITFNSVMTVMNRLMKKGHLQKKKECRGKDSISRFTAIQTKEQFIIEQTKAVSYALIYEYGDFVVNHMIDVLKDYDPEILATIQVKIRTLKNSRIG